jgi:hypothetical protein
MTLVSACSVIHLVVTGLVVTGLYRHVRNQMYVVVSS